ncbi:MAG: hypothetical protein HY812_16915 [Planctomycetes bacterium]|nr:hypothetical protein [Planctomycetota bacterium]
MKKKVLGLAAVVVLAGLAFPVLNLVLPQDNRGRILGGQSFEYMGLRQDYFAKRGSVQEADHGLFNFTKKDCDRHKFKVPTLRNVALTWPYLRDGTVNELGEAVRVTARFQSDVALASAEVESIASFLESLTGELGGKPLK